MLPREPRSHPAHTGSATPYVPVFIIREKVGEVLKGHPFSLCHVLPRLREPVDGSALEAGQHRLQTVEVVQLQQFLCEDD